jgi:uncharacterized protein YciI
VFIVTMTYTAPLEQVDALLPDHVAWLERNYAAGRFLASGRQVPRVGGVILARAESREELLAVLAEDPFQKAGVAQLQLAEFLPTMTSPELESLRVTLG